MPQLRIGFLAHDWAQVEPWVHRLIDRMISDKKFTITALIEADAVAEPANQNWLYKLINPIESKLFARPVQTDTMNVKTLFESQSPLKTGDTNTILSQKLDVIVSVEPGLADRQLAGFSCHGVWFPGISGLQALSAVTGKEPVAKIELLRFTNDYSDPELIAEASINPKLLLARNVLSMKEKAVVLITRELNRLADAGFVGAISQNEIVHHSKVGTSAVVSYYISVVNKMLVRGFATLKRKSGIRPDKFTLRTGTGNALDFDPKATIEIIPDGNNFWADPFLWERDGKTYCFYEHYSRATKLGHIQVGVLEGDQMRVLGDALKTDIHLSFPFLFEEDGELYMMPETCANKRIEIWRCTVFPLKWELHSTALEGHCAADSMILRRDGKWWLFTNIGSDVYCDNCSELHIFEIDGPDLKKVKPHAANPVVMDSRTARNAGRFHEIDGQLIRPSQDNSHGQYGFGLNMMVVEDLSLESYRERLVRRINPKFDPTIAACHHFDQLGDRFIMDALKTN
ncbi:MAG: hypothetical protein HKO02_15455 [Hyphomonadaceae bacterium]|nr:hypothetical protein [Hyphomonadaceae bacterium]